MISPKIAIKTQNKYKTTTVINSPTGSPPPSNARTVDANIAPTIINGDKRIRIGEKSKVSPKTKGEVSPANQHTTGNNPSAIKAIPAYAI